MVSKLLSQTHVTANCKDGSGEGGILRMGTSAPSDSLRSTILRVRELELLQWVVKSVAQFGMSLERYAVSVSSGFAVHRVCTTLAPASQAG